MAKKTTNTKTSTKKTSKVKNTADTKAETSELILNNNEKEPECVANTDLPIIGEGEDVAVSAPFIENEIVANDIVEYISDGIKDDEIGVVVNFVSCENISDLENNITSKDTTASTITIDREWELLKDDDKTKKMYETNIIHEMNIKELNTYKEAIDKLISNYTNLCEMNRGYDDKIYFESLGILNKLQSYSTRINDTIKNKIFSLE
jgi:hypothetical protein